MTIDRPKSKQPLPNHATKVFNGVVFDVYQWEQPQFDGSTKTFEKLSRADSVEIVAVTAEGKFIVLFEEQPGKEPFQGIPGGQVDVGEQPLEAAQRELREETGYESDQWRFWLSYQGLSKIEWCNYIFVANNCNLNMLAHHDSGEKIQVAELDFDQWLEFMLHPECRSDKIKLEILLAERAGKLGQLKHYFLN
ncbi:MAG: NUDIX hydrolase [Patescibacteria group bacterium]